MALDVCLWMYKPGFLNIDVWVLDECGYRCLHPDVGTASICTYGPGCMDLLVWIWTWIWMNVPVWMDVYACGCIYIYI